MSKIAGNIAIVCGISVMAYVGAGADPAFPWNTDRSAGMPLDGKWYSVSDHGCFHDSIVYEISNDTILGHLKGRSYPMTDWRFQPEGNWVLVTMPSDPRQEQSPLIRTWYRDLGASLEARFVELEGKRVPLDEDRHTFSRCTTPSYWGLISSLWKKSDRKNS